jgi:hypothetical protein
MSDVTRILQAIEDGDRSAGNELPPQRDCGFAVPQSPLQIGRLHLVQMGELHAMLLSFCRTRT